jgi:hypothetical protein
LVLAKCSAGREHDIVLAYRRNPAAIVGGVDELSEVVQVERELGGSLHGADAVDGERQIDVDPGGEAIGVARTTSEGPAPFV